MMPSNTNICIYEEMRSYNYKTVGRHVIHVKRFKTLIMSTCILIALADTSNQVKERTFDMTLASAEDNCILACV